MIHRALLTSLAGACLLGVCACGTPDYEGGAAPAQDESWDVVSEALGVRCGSLDCHGQSARPLRLYHHQGLRLDAAAVPGSGRTSPAEHDANLRAVLGLEPELTAQVLRETGREPERLSLYRKALGLEKHAGERVVAAGSAADECLRSWLAGAVDTDACQAAARLQRPSP